LERALIETVFFEQQIAEHPTAQRIRKALHRASWVPIDRYQELFNKRHQNFKLQKKNPALILAKNTTTSFYQCLQALAWTLTRVFISLTCTIACMIVNIASYRACILQQILFYL